MSARRRTLRRLLIVIDAGIETVVPGHGPVLTASSARRIATLAPAAARMNKQTIRALNKPLATEGRLHDAMYSIADVVQDAYRYADSPEHREGIQAFVEKRKPDF